jgi:hypothetical protein
MKKNEEKGKKREKKGKRNPGKESSAERSSKKDEAVAPLIFSFFF